MSIASDSTGTGPTFGIDLGTTFSCIATFNRQYGKTEILKNREGKSTTPSVVFAESDTGVVVGDQAVAQLRGVNARRVVSFAKRRLADDEACKRGDFGYPVSNGSPLTPITVSGHILAKLATENPSVHNLVGKATPRVVITYPAYFTASARERTIQAGRAAGLDVIGTIEEPVAAAMSYGFNEDIKSKTVLVYDLGGGTFDVSVIRFDERGQGTVLAKDGDPLLGGVDWDNAFGLHIWERYVKECPQKMVLDKKDFCAGTLDDIEKLRKVNAFRRLAQMAKHGLSEKSMDVYDIECDNEGTCIQVTVEEFDRVTKNRLEETFNIVDKVLAVCPPEDISAVLLVGGSSRMRQVWSGLESAYPAFRGKLRLEDPDEAVAKGAAIYAAQIAENGGGGGIRNIAPRSYGVEAVNVETGASYISNIILKDDRVPAERTKIYTTIAEGQSEMKIEVYESECKKCDIQLDEGKKITKEQQCVRFNRPVPKGTPVAVTFRLSNDGVLSVDAHSQVDDGAVSFTLQLEGTLDERGLTEARDQIAGVAKR